MLKENREHTSRRIVKKTAGISQKISDRRKGPVMSKRGRHSTKRTVHLMISLKLVVASVGVVDDLVMCKAVLCAKYAALRFEKCCSENKTIADVAVRNNVKGETL